MLGSMLAEAFPHVYRLFLVCKTTFPSISNEKPTHTNNKEPKLSKKIQTFLNGGDLLCSSSSKPKIIPDQTRTCLVSSQVLLGFRRLMLFLAVIWWSTIHMQLIQCLDGDCQGFRDTIDGFLVVGGLGDIIYKTGVLAGTILGLGTALDYVARSCQKSCMSLSWVWDRISARFRPG